MWHVSNLQPPDKQSDVHPAELPRPADQLCKVMSVFISSAEQCSGKAIVLPPALALASASTNVNVFAKVFKTSLFPNLIISLIHLGPKFCAVPSPPL